MMNMPTYLALKIKNEKYLTPFEPVIELSKVKHIFDENQQDKDDFKKRIIQELIDKLEAEFPEPKARKGYILRHNEATDTYIEVPKDAYPNESTKPKEKKKVK